MLAWLDATLPEHASVERGNPFASDDLKKKQGKCDQQKNVTERISCISGVETLRTFEKFGSLSAHNQTMANGEKDSHHGFGASVTSTGRRLAGCRAVRNSVPKPTPPPLTPSGK